MQAVVVTLDHLAVAFVGCCGNASAHTPHFDRLAADSVVFDQCFSTAEPTDSAAGIQEVAGGLIDRGGVAVFHECSPDAPEDTSLRKAIAAWRQASESDRQGLLWLACSAIASPWSAAAARIDASRRDLFDDDALYGALAAALASDGAESLSRTDSPESWIEAALPALRDGGWLDRERFADAPAMGRLRRSIYAAAVTQLDAWLGRLLDLLDADRSHDLLLIVTAGSGDLAGPHPELAAGCPPLLDPLLRVPLFVRTGTEADGTRRQALVSTTDIAPTLSEWFQQVCTGATRDSRNLWPLLRDEVHTVRDELLIGSPALGWRLQTPEFACLCNAPAAEGESRDPSAESADRPWLFVKPDDVWDTLDVARQKPAVTDEMLRRIRTTAGLHGKESTPK